MRFLVQFRAVCLKPDLRPYTGNVTYQVMDPNDNIVLLENNAQLNHGVAGGEFSLNKDAFEGDWKIVYIVAVCFTSKYLSVFNLPFLRDS